MKLVRNSIKEKSNDFISINVIEFFNRVKSQIPDYFLEHIFEATDGELESCWICGGKKVSHLLKIRDYYGRTFEILTCKECIEHWLKKKNTKRLIIEYKKIKVNEQ